MKRLFVLRHAKASHDDPSLDDFDRPLTERGKRDAQRVGGVLVELAAPPSLVLCSPAKRTRKTAKRALKASGLETKLQLVPELYLAPLSVIESVIRQFGKEEQVMLVGHNPGLEDLVSQLAGEPCSLPTTGFAEFELELDDWARFSLGQPGRLVGFWTPKSAE